MLNQLLYYLFVLPVSKIPLNLSYLIFDGIYLVIYYIIPYRKKVVTANIARSFPDKTAKEHKKLVRQFYRFLSQMFAESIHNLSISEKEIKKRMVIENPEVMDELYKNNKSVLLLSSHFNNWEFLISGQNLFFKHQALGIGMPLSNKFWDKKITARRERHGMIVVNAHNYKEKLKENSHQPTATLILGDQNPSKAENAYWTTFLNQETGFFFGAEIMANQLDYAVVHASISRKKRGFYSINLDVITEQPRQEEYGFVTQTYIDFLEKSIQENPPYWLWSHKRWKMGVPKNLYELKQAHKQRFVEKFRAK